MTIEQKKEALLNALGESWDKMFRDFKWKASENNANLFELSGELGPYNPIPYLAGCVDANSSKICVEYNPKEDRIGIYLKYRPIDSKFQGDLENIFNKYTPFDMKLSFEENLTPTISREERVEPTEFAAFLDNFRKAYNEYFAIFYMVTVCETELYDGFAFKCYDVY